jgi:hypothetical protein
LLLQNFLQHRWIDRFLENHALQPLKAAPLDNMILIVIEGGH